MDRIRSKYLVITSDYVLPGAIIIGVLCLLWLTFFSPYFAVSQIICETDYEPCENNALEAEINKYRGVNIFRFDDDILKRRILSGEFTIRQVDVKRILPNRLVISCESIFPTLAVKQISDPRYLTLDRDFRVIKITTTKPNVISVTVPIIPAVQVGKTLGDNLLPLFRLALGLSQKLEGIQEINAQQDGSVVVTLSKIKVIMSPTVDLTRQISLLQAVLSDTTIVTGKREVDVRFAQPVLR